MTNVEVEVQVQVEVEEEEVEVEVVEVLLTVTCVDKANCFWLLAAAFCSTHSSRENTSMTCSISVSSSAAQ